MKIEQARQQATKLSHIAPNPYETLPHELTDILTGIQQKLLKIFYRVGAERTHYKQQCFEWQARWLDVRKAIYGSVLPCDCGGEPHGPYCSVFLKIDADSTLKEILDRIKATQRECNRMLLALQFIAQCEDLKAARQAAYQASIACLTGTPKEEIDANHPNP